MLKLYLYSVMLLLLIVVSLGFIFPYLYSSKDDFLVVIGVITSLLFPVFVYGICIYIKLQFKKIVKEKEKNED